MAPDLITALRLALRARYFHLVFWLSVILAVAVVLASLFSGRQPATVGLDVGLSVIRLALPVVVVLLLQELLTREFDRKFFLTSMTYPRPRHLFVIGRFLAVFVLASALLLLLAVVLMPLVVAVNSTYEQATPVALDERYWLVIAFIAVDILVISAMGTVLAVVAVTPSFVLIGTLGFMLVARSFAPIVALLTRDTTLVSDAATYRSSLDLLGYLLPDLSALDIRMVVLYGQMSFLPPDWLLRVITALVYAIGLIALAVWALDRKRFA